MSNHVTEAEALGGSSPEEAAGEGYRDLHDVRDNGTGTRGSTGNSTGLEPAGNLLREGTNRNSIARFLRDHYISNSLRHQVIDSADMTLEVVDQDEALESLFGNLMMRSRSEQACSELNGRFSNHVFALQAGPGWGKSFVVNQIAQKTGGVRRIAAKVRSDSTGRTFGELLDATTTIPITFNHRTSVDPERERPEFSLIARVLYSYCRGDSTAIAFHTFVDNIRRECIHLTFPSTMEAIFEHLEELGKEKSVFILVDEVVKANGRSTFVEDFSKPDHPMWSVIKILFDFQAVYSRAENYMAMVTALDYASMTSHTLSDRPVEMSKPLRPLLQHDSSYDDLRRLLRLDPHVFNDPTMKRALPLVHACGGNPRYLRHMQIFLRSREFNDLTMDSPTAVMDGMQAFVSQQFSAMGALAWTRDVHMDVLHSIVYPVNRNVLDLISSSSKMTVSQLIARGDLFGDVKESQCVPYIPFVRTIHLLVALIGDPVLYNALDNLFLSAVSRHGSFGVFIARFIVLRCMSTKMHVSTVSLLQLLFPLSVRNHDGRKLKCTPAFRENVGEKLVHFRDVRHVVFLDRTDTSIAVEGAPFTAQQHDCILVVHYGESNPGFDILVLFPTRAAASSDVPFFGVAINTKVQMKGQGRDLFNVKAASSATGAGWFQRLIPHLIFGVVNCGNNGSNISDTALDDDTFVLSKEGLEDFIGPTLWRGPAFFHQRIVRESVV